MSRVERLNVLAPIEADIGVRTNKRPYMEIDFYRIKELEKENMILKSEIQRLKNLLEDAGVEPSPVTLMLHN
jgi:hypothetical protein